MCPSRRRARVTRDPVGAMPALLALIAATLIAAAVFGPVTAAAVASTTPDATATAGTLAPRGLIAPLLGTPWVMLQSFASFSPHPTAMVGTPPVLDPMASVKIPTALQTRVAIAMDGGAMDDDVALPRLATRNDATTSARSTTVIAAPTPSISRNSTSTDTDPTATPTPTSDAPDRPARTSTSTTSSRTASTTSTTTIIPGPRALPPPPADYTLPASATAPVVANTATAAPAKPTSDVDSGVDERYRDAHLTPEQVANVETHGTLLQIVGTTDKPAWWTAVAAAKWAPVAVAGVILAATVGGIVGWRWVRRRRRAAKGEMVVGAAGDEEGGVATANDAMLGSARS
ncbi:hypothetical protein AMAG_07324 [Allomyces macrogynus ATCC 38327]|uniref:Uncharacterized protein n=1 Tax=Allomyces macrogynus (strain ATCC 38327) TaxID=578462 RepID=A0A0L0SIA8_ALLM3|nr:hypothetical protein AMAG_07324 [Allomyces macrogynus ATCC 38327]|eukprot:KNE62070.1 hypothetical protein AMAG_07324 [Allomyces macrogynus ATCC 38327]